jgi:hypothetical protein
MRRPTIVAPICDVQRWSAKGMTVPLNSIVFGRRLGRFRLVDQRTGSRFYGNTDLDWVQG